MKIKKYLRVFSMLLCIFILASNITAFAESTTATLSRQKIYVDGKLVDILAYSIKDYNNVRIRELGKVADFSVFYDASTNSVRIDRSRPYIGGDTEVLPSPGDNVPYTSSGQTFFANGNPVNITAYNIADNNYAQLRDVCGAINLGLAYDPVTNSVYIDTQTAYLPNMPPEMLRPEAIPQQTPSNPPQVTDKTPITEKILDGSEWTREDFSQQANPAIFDSVFTRAAYNTIRQSIVDQDIILADNNEDGYNLYYRYGNFIDLKYSSNGVPGDTYSAMSKVLSKFDGYHKYELGIEPYVKNRYDYPGYRICKAVTHEFFAPANQATEEFIRSLGSLPTDREKIKRINDHVCEHLDYNADSIATVNDMFASDKAAFGACGVYTNAILYLCQRANLPCVSVKSETHAWNEVYVDGRWYVLDATANDIDSPNYNIIFLMDTHPDYNDQFPKHTAFAKELLVPGRTK